LLESNKPTEKADRALARIRYFVYTPKTMKNPSLLPAALVLAVIPLSAAAQNVAGQFDDYTLAMSWEPAFCEGKPAAPECASQPSGRFDTDHLALHGLWPNKDGDSAHSYGNCGVDQAQQDLDRAPTWCRLPEPPLSAATRVELTAVMPGVASCLDHHEWSKHGTCSGMNADDYFSLAAAIVRQVSETSFGRYLTAHAGKTVEASAVIEAFEKDFGAGSGSKLSLNCTDVRGSKALLEVRLHLPNPPGPASELTSMPLDAGDRGNCPESFLLDPIPTR
jgi:ribonuclease T2